MRSRVERSSFLLLCVVTHILTQSVHLPCFSSCAVKGMVNEQYRMYTQQNTFITFSSKGKYQKHLRQHYKYCITVFVLTPSWAIHVFRKIYYMKPQAGILFLAHSYSKQYIQSYQSQMRAIWWGSQTHSTIYTILYHISRQWVACFEQVSRRSRASEEKWQLYRKDSALGCFFSRAVNSCVGKLLIKRGVHICLSFFQHPV